MTDHDEAYRRSRQSGTQIRGDAAQRRLLVGRASSPRAAAASFSRRAPRITAASARFAAPARDLAAHAGDLHERERPRGRRAREFLQDRAAGNSRGARRARSAAGIARLKKGGGTGGHNGLNDIAARLGTKDFWRLRLGIGHPRDSATPQQDVADYVLHPPGAEDRAAIEQAIDAQPRRLAAHRRGQAAKRRC